MSKVKNLAILGVGYVLGTKAGRARYEQLKQQATRVAEHPKTQQLARTAREQVASRLPGAVTERLPRSVSSRLGNSGASGSSSVGYPDESAPTGHDSGVRASAASDREVIVEPAVEATTPPNRPSTDS